LRLAVIGLFGGGIFVLAMNGAVALAGATVTAFVAGLYAVAAAVLAVPLLGERLRLRTVVAFLAALLGTAFISEVYAGAPSVDGVAMALIAAGAFGCFLVLSRRWAAVHQLSGQVVALALLSVSAVVAVAVAIATHDAVVVSQPSIRSLVALGWVAIGPGAAASVLAVIAMRRLRAAQASTLFLLNPPVAATLAFVLLGERLSATQVGGAVLVLAAIVGATVGLPTRMAFPRNSRRGSEPPPRS
jgi:probable blue pigment (indigoidine) exporter